MWKEIKPQATVESNFQHWFDVHVWCGILKNQPIFRLSSKVLLQVTIIYKTSAATIRRCTYGSTIADVLRTRRNLSTFYPCSENASQWSLSWSMDRSWRCTDLANRVSRPKHSRFLSVGANERPGERKVETQDALLRRILDAAVHIKFNRSELMWHTRTVHRRADMCIEADGGNFEQLL